MPSSRVRSSKPKPLSPRLVQHAESPGIVRVQKGSHSYVRGTRPYAPFFAVVGYSICSLLLMAVALELTSWAGWQAYHWMRPTYLDLRQSSPVYSGQPWATEFWREERSRFKTHTNYSPFTLWATPVWHGRYINNDLTSNGTWRRTINPGTRECGNKRRIVIWMFGGSTLYGTGVPDWATVPSYLSTRLNDHDSNCSLVTNIGVEGYVSNQEVLQLSNLLKTGQRPDIVVFYDGVNDAATAGFLPGPPSAHFYFGMIKNRVEGSIAGRLDFIHNLYVMQLIDLLTPKLLPSPPAALTQLELRDKVRMTLDNYEANLRITGALSKAFDFEFYSFWQPSLYYGHKHKVPFEREALQSDMASENSTWTTVVSAVYQGAEQRSRNTGHFVFLGSLFDSVTEPLFLDEAHLGPRANELVGAFIAQYIQDHSNLYARQQQ